MSIIFRVQTLGLGGLKPNTVILGWPYGWSKARHDRSWFTFLETVRTVSAARMALLVPKGINCYPESTEKVENQNYQITYLERKIVKIT
jgi:potassium/chloride transporter 4/5/6